MKVDVAALTVGLVSVAVAIGALAIVLRHSPLPHMGVIAPVTLITIGVVGLLASRRGNNHP